jgi:hypothetical protein
MHHESTGSPKNTIEGFRHKTIRILSHGKVVSEAQIQVQMKEWILVMPGNFDP